MTGPAGPPHAAPPPPPPPPRTLLVSIASSTGLVREHNEDAVGLNGFTLQGDTPRSLHLALPLNQPQAVVVCDGMGGHAGGAEASSIAAQRTSSLPESGIYDEETVRSLYQRVADELNDLSDRYPDLHGLGTTVAAAYVRIDGSVLVANVGDARAYGMESGYEAQLTVDHRNPGTGGLTQALGGGRRVVLSPTFYPTVIDESGIVLCSDGIWEYAGPDAVGTELARTDTPVPLPDRLVQLALAGGGGDNATAVHLRLAPVRPQP
ncbi:serine/threonine-protein phosphatase [Gordonia alkaliphila]|uniref:Stp1/IreP family PP2C-type Ser/Thr phosphatase n=1 Tax=Gordonia alkaliphila TaxID=1053547 RepID=A0ABP8ZJB2_9ACTN